MSDQFNFENPKVNETEREAARGKILYEWSDDQRNTRYKGFFGQEPKESMSDEEVTDAILDPEKERTRILREKYKTIIRQSAKASMSNEAIIDALLDPEREHRRVLAENLDEDRENRGQNRGGGK